MYEVCQELVSSIASFWLKGAKYVITKAGMVAKSTQIKNNL